MYEKISVEYQEEAVSPQVTLNAKELSCEIIETAVNDVKSTCRGLPEKEAEEAFIYLHSEQFLRHCEIASLNPEFLIGRKLVNHEGYLRLSLRMNKSRHLAGSTSKEFKRTVKSILSDQKKLKKIIIPTDNQKD